MNFAGPITVLTLLALAGGWLAWRRLWRDRTQFNRNPLARAGTLAAGIIRGVAALAGVAVGRSGAGDLVATLCPWDAWTTWTVRPRVWSELRQLLPFVDPQRWLADTTGSVYTIYAWTYPYTAPLLALWPTLAYGAWNETAANLPWLGAALAFGLRVLRAGAVVGCGAVDGTGFYLVALVAAAAGHLMSPWRVTLISGWRRCSVWR